MKTSYVYLFSGLLSAAMLVGCGGSSGGGGAADTTVEPTAEITEANKTDLAVAAAEATNNAANAEAPTNAGGFGFKTTVRNVASKALQMPNMETVPNICTSGSVDVTGMDSYETSNIDMNITFNNCVIDDYYETATYNGSVSYTENGNGLTMTYRNFTVTINGETTSINGTMTCDLSYNCTENLTFSGDISGAYSSTTYTTNNMEVSGDDTSGYNVNGSVTHPDHGTISISASGVLFNCTSGVPSAGTITVTASGGVTATVTFNDCSSFTIDYGDVTTTVNWSEYGL
ncbi:MAG TPA: hypothetical protein VIQ81_03930 [Gammaproteobacteria bacterium]